MTATCMECGNQITQPKPNVWICDACREKFRKMRQEKIDKIWHGGRDDAWQDIAPPKRYVGACWDTLDAPLQKQVVPFIGGQQDLLTFTGCPGVGKTWAAWAIAGAFLVDHREPTHWFTNWYALCEAARDSRLFGETGEGNRDWLYKLKTAELLVIDEFATARPYEAEFMSVMSVIHYRFDCGLATILITTKSDTEMTEVLGEAMVSRINSGLVVKMLGRDRRKK